jgi:hypothetical protein
VVNLVSWWKERIWHQPVFGSSCKCWQFLNWIKNFIQKLAIVGGLAEKLIWLTFTLLPQFEELAIFFGRITPQLKLFYQIKKIHLGHLGHLADTHFLEMLLP